MLGATLTQFRDGYKSVILDLKQKFEDPSKGNK